MTKFSIKELLKLINSYTLFSLLLNLTRLFAGLICIRWVSPEEMGAWQIMLLIEGYLMFARFGIINALNRELPYYLGRNRKEKALKYLDVSEWYIICVSLLFFILIISSLLVYSPHLNHWKECVIVLSVYLPIKFYSGFIEFTFRSGRDFKKLAIVQFALTLFTFLTLIMVYYMGFYGYLIRILFLTILGCLLLIWYRPFRFNPRMDFPYFRKLFRMGIPLFISNYSQSVFNSFPGILLLHYGNVGSLGLFYPVNIVMNFGTLIPGIVSTYLYPQTSFEYGANRDARQVIRKNESASLHSMIMMLPVIVISFFLLPFVFNKFAPEYHEAMAASQWALLFAMLSCLSLMLNPFAILKAWKPMYIYLIMAGIFTWFVPYLMLHYWRTYSILLTLVLSLLIVKILLIGVNYICIGLIKSNYKT
ncbi:MAG: oligosaccharide flippase family protein [Saprospiraceae bacterium]